MSHRFAADSLASPTPPAGGDSLEKQAHLFIALAGLPSLLVAFSGGTDSAYLAWAAHQALGERALAVTALSASISAFDREHAVRFAREANLRHELLKTREFSNPLYVANGPDRCYHCKDELFRRMELLAIERRFAAIAYGVNRDDTRDFRPGHRAAHEHRVLAPLLDAGMTKAEIRALSRRAGLSTWDRPASPCLSSRVPYGTLVTPEALRRIEAGEAVLRELGFRQCRVRFFGALARIELERDLVPLALQSNVLAALRERFAAIGFERIEIDPEGYRQGSLNGALAQAGRE